MDSKLKQRPETLVEQLLALEKFVGGNTSYEILEPFRIVPNDIVGIQAAARKIASFVGLRDYTFVVSVCKQEKGVGGNIELKHGETGIFIEISEAAEKFEEAVLATLAHEIAHKYLHIRGIDCKSTTDVDYQNEVFTDLTAVFLGLGKLMLAGCECSRPYDAKGRADNGPKLPMPPVNSDPRATGDEVTYTETYQCGYLNRSQLALAFLIICGMRRIQASTYESGLRPEVLLSLKNCRATYPQYFGRHKNGAGIGDEFEELILGAQSILSEISRTLTYLKGTYIETLDSFLRNTHVRINELQRISEGLERDKPIDPCIHYLNCLSLIPLVAELKQYSRQGELYSAGAIGLARIVQTMEDPKCIPSEGLFTIVVCPNDGVTKLRLPADSGSVIARCPHCRYRFITKTSPPVFSPPSIWKRLLGFLKTSTRRVRG